MMTGFLEKIKRLIFKSSDTDTREAEFAQSTKALVTACQTTCEAADTFIAFLSGFLNQLQTIRHTIEGTRYLSELSAATSVVTLTNEQLPTINAAITSVSTQIETRTQVLDKNLEALDNLKNAIDTVQGQVDAQLIQQLNEALIPLKTRTERQRLSIQSFGAQIAKEYTAIANLFDDNIDIAKDG